MFAEQARRLSGHAGAVLQWSPDVFWSATPDELMTIFEALAGDVPVPPGTAALARLMEAFPDG